jgi:hypothetical protein
MKEENLDLSDSFTANESLESVASSMASSVSMWQTKPWWCQPWSIVLTGIVIPTVSWLLLHRLWITLPVVGVILVWWILFLKLVPDQYAAQYTIQPMTQQTAQQTAGIKEIVDKGEF